MLTLLLFSWGAVEARVHYLEDETRRLYTQSEQRFRALFPEQTRIVDMPMQLKALQRQPVALQNTRMADLINLIEQVIGASNVQVQRIEFRLAEGWKIQLSANSFAELEQLRERGRQQGMPVRLDSANREGNRVQATLTLEQGI
jgi:general secretion pathway protein L